MVPRSPPDPLTHSTSTSAPVSGSFSLILAEVLPPPKLVMRLSLPSRLERYKRSSAGESRAACASSQPLPISRGARGAFWTTVINVSRRGSGAKVLPGHSFIKERLCITQYGHIQSITCRFDHAPGKREPMLEKERHNLILKLVEERSIVSVG